MTCENFVIFSSFACCFNLLAAIISKYLQLLFPRFLIHVAKAKEVQTLGLICVYTRLQSQNNKLQKLESKRILLHVVYALWYERICSLLYNTRYKQVNLKIIKNTSYYTTIGLNSNAEQVTGVD